MKRGDGLSIALSKKWVVVGFEEILWASKYKIRGFNDPLWTLCAKHIKNLSMIKKSVHKRKALSLYSNF